MTQELGAPFKKGTPNPSKTFWGCDMQMDKNEALKFFERFYRGARGMPHRVGNGEFLIRPFGDGWQIDHPGELATTDFDMMTRLVFMAHHYCYRLSVFDGKFGHLSIAIFKRSRNPGDGFQRHPTIEEALEKFSELIEVEL